MAQILRLSTIGTMPGGEVWSINPIFRISGAGDIITNSEAVAIVTAVNAITIPADLRIAMNSATTVTGSRVEARFLDGSLEMLYEAPRGSAVAGTGTSPHPFQTSFVTSLRTIGVGASARGRVYWPATGVALTSSSLRISSATVTQLLGAMKTYLAAIETAIEGVLGVSVSLVVWSRKNASTTDVSKLQVGDILDTQRRRRDSALELYQEVSYP